MIASQKIGKSFMGALGYNLSKLNHRDQSKRAELLDSNFASLDKKLIRQEVELVRQLRPNLNRYVYHTSLNFSQEEQQALDNKKLLAIAHDYLTANGFNNNQYMIFRHYDADHPHLHLLVNRIRFDGTVVSDSNNYQKSEAILRDLEVKYKLLPVKPSREANQRAAKKDELEMVVRTGQPSHKMVLQERMNKLVSQRHRSIQELIAKGERGGIFFLFNQASTGRITGVTYCYNGFKIKGQALGNRYKWSELIKKINYEQVRDSKAISEANSRTRARYGDTAAGRDAGRSQGLFENPLPYPSNDYSESAGAGNAGSKDKPGGERSLETSKDVDLADPPAFDNEYSRADGFIDVQISDDVDDEAVYGKRRRRERGSGYSR
jgi:hypothetical protein